MPLEILDPTHEGDSAGFQRADRLASLEGKTIAIVSNGKRGTQPFFDALEAEFLDTYRASKVVRLTKSNYSAPAEPELLSEAHRWNALVAGVGD